MCRERQALLVVLLFSVSASWMHIARQSYYLVYRSRKREIYVNRQPVLRLTVNRTSVVMSFWCNLQVDRTEHSNSKKKLKMWKIDRSVNVIHENCKLQADEWVKQQMLCSVHWTLLSFPSCSWCNLPDVLHPSCPSSYRPIAAARSPANNAIKEHCYF